MIVRPFDGGLRALAPAKLNLYLEILGKRSDGYHEIETLMVTIDLFDTLTFRDAPSGEITLGCDDPRLSTGDDNLVVRAAKALRGARGAGRTLGATIELEKRIPAQAGLGGGSSDAAATLVALDRLWGLETPAVELDAIAATLGSDVPFFLHSPAAVCRGRGERVEAIEFRGNFHFVLLCPPTGVSTADVYRALQVPDRPGSPAATLEAFRAGDPEALGQSLFNRLQPAAERVNPDLGPARDALVDATGDGLAGSLMSGSGSAYFGLARDRDAARRVAGQLERLGYGWVRIVTCGP